MRYLLAFSVFFAFPALAEEDINGLINKVCDKTVLSCDDDRQNALSQEATEKRIDRAAAVTSALDFHIANPEKDNHVIFNMTNHDFSGDGTAFGVGYMRNLNKQVDGLAAGISFATDVNGKDQGLKATVSYAW